MKNIILASAAFGLAFIGSVATASAGGAVSLCNLETLHGTYVYSGFSEKSASAGMEYYDGKGKIISLQQTAGSAGTLVNGTYTVNGCIATTTYSNGVYTNYLSPTGDTFTWAAVSGSTEAGDERRFSTMNLLAK
ncbi:MAG: hypothetical protein ACR652_18340 [Methylocystis sp.]|uniref:hypothetical protein n=1 Tax=Methylocystis sp. TaxID=1911079 RepID=UPI003DA1F17D